MSNEFASKDYTAGQLNAMVKKIVEHAGENGPTLLLQDKLTVVIPSLIDWVGDISFSRAVDPLYAKVVFNYNNRNVKFCCIHPDFQDMFLSNPGAVSYSKRGLQIRYGDLTMQSCDRMILGKFEYSSHVEFNLSEIYYLLRQHAVGKESGLKTTGCYENIFYVVDSSRSLRAVSLALLERGWVIRSYPIDFKSPWSLGDRVFARVLQCS